MSGEQKSNREPGVKSSNQTRASLSAQGPRPDRPSSELQTPNPELSTASTSRTWLLTAIVAGALLLIAGGRMLLGHSANRAETLLEPPEMLEARNQLLANPKNEALKEQIREMDRDLRQRYFSHLDTNALGSWLLLGCGVILIFSAGKWAASHRHPPMPGPVNAEAKNPYPRAQQARWAITAAGAAVIVLLFSLSASVTSRLPATTAEWEALLASAEPEAPADPPPTPEEWAANWPMFRGPRGDGIATTTNAPLQWDSETGQGIRWRVPVPSPGHSSPVVWKNRIFLTGGTEESRHVLCFDSEQGELLWNRPIPPPPGGFSEPLEIPEETGFAACTPATDGRRVFAIFATGELVALDFSGRIVWSKALGVPDNMYGHATSLVVYQDVLLVQYDQGDGEDGKSRLYALESATGEVRWQQPRTLPSSWGTPIVAEASGQTQVLTLGEPYVIGYTFDTGKELWRLDCLGTDLAPMPVMVDDLVIVVSPGNHVSGLRTDGQGDVTDTHQAWQYDEFVPDITSPLSDGELVYLLITYGDFVCIDGTTGETVWEAELEQEFNASPTLVGDHIYLFGTEGTALVAQTGREFKELARSNLPEPVYASPAFVGDRIILRGKAHLFCVDGTSTSPPEQP